MAYELIEYRNGVAALAASAVEKIATLERELKRLEDEEKALKKKLLTEMEENGVLSLKTELLTISYKSASTRESVDTKALREDYKDSPEMMALLDEYTKVTDVAASVAIRVNGKG